MITPGGLILAILAHLALFGLFLLPSCTSVKLPEDAEIVDFTVVIDENLDKDPDDLKPVKDPPPPPPKPVEIPKPEPPKLDSPKADAVVKEVEKPKPPEVKKPDPPKPPEKPKFNPGELKVNNKPQPVKKFDPGKQLVGNGPRTEKRLSPEEMKRLLAMGARAGTRNQVPKDEISLCYSLIKRKFTEKWETPAWSPNQGVAMLEIQFGAGGRVMGYRIVKSSGDRDMDQSILAAAKRMGSVYGLTADFLAANPRVTIDCVVEAM